MLVKNTATALLVGYCSLVSGQGEKTNALPAKRAVVDGAATQQLHQHDAGAPSLPERRVLAGSIAKGAASLSSSSAALDNSSSSSSNRKLQTPKELYYELAWVELPPAIQDAYTVLGMNEALWDEGGDSEAGMLDWAMLNEQQQAAAISIGYNEESWCATEQPTPAPIQRSEVTGEPEESTDGDSGDLTPATTDADADAPQCPEALPNKIRLADGDVRFSYAIVDDSILCAQMQSNTVSWMGFGISPTGLMADGYGIIGVADPAASTTRQSDDEGSVTKWKLTNIDNQRLQPVPPEQQTLMHTSFEQRGGRTIMKFAKYLVEEGEPSIVLGEENTFLYALGANNEIGYHAKRDSFVVDLTSSTDTETPEEEEVEGTTCIKITTGGKDGDNGRLIVSIDSGNGFQQVEEGSHPLLDLVHDECYATFVGLQVTSDSENDWVGTIEYSNDNKETYVPFICENCDSTSTSTEANPIVVDGDAVFGTDGAHCGNGATCSLIKKEMFPVQAPDDTETPADTPAVTLDDTETSTLFPTEALVPAPAPATQCILVTVGSFQGDNGPIVFYVDQGIGFEEVFSGTRPPGEVMIDECYPNIVGVQVTSNSLNDFVGSFEYSADERATYGFMTCDDCDDTSTSDVANPIIVDGDTATEKEGAHCLNGAICNLIKPALVMQPVTDTETTGLVPASSPQTDLTTGSSPMPTMTNGGKPAHSMSMAHSTSHSMSMADDGPPSAKAFKASKPKPPTYKSKADGYDKVPKAHKADTSSHSKSTKSKASKSKSAKVSGKATKASGDTGVYDFNALERMKMSSNDAVDMRRCSSVVLSLAMGLAVWMGTSFIVC